MITVDCISITENGEAMGIEWCSCGCGRFSTNMYVPVKEWKAVGAPKVWKIAESMATPWDSK
jgi:hypothetical protein